MPLAQDAVQTVCNFRVLLNFIRVGGADGRNQIGVRDADFHEVDHSVEFERAERLQIRIVKARSQRNAEWEQPLIAEVVNSEYRPSSCECPNGTVEPGQVGWNQSGLVIVAMKNI